jgi:hypothetical protein
MDNGYRYMMRGVAVQANDNPYFLDKSKINIYNISKTCLNCVARLGGRRFYEAPAWAAFSLLRDTASKYCGTVIGFRTTEASSPIR